jgi:8-oxo-dGTP diphosphatase
MQTKKINIATDVVVEYTENGKAKILLIKRKAEPHAQKWALPGGILEPDEEVQTGAERELKEETNLQVDLKNWQFIDFFDAPDRDPRGRVISFAYGVKVTDKTTVRAGSDADEFGWFATDDLPELAFDHRTIIARWAER